MGYDYYEERRKQEEKALYRNQFGFIIPRGNESLAYSNRDMDPESLKRFEANNMVFALVDMLDKSRKENTPKLNTPIDLSEFL